MTWSKVSGFGDVVFGNPNAVDTTASFSAAGTYVLRLTAPTARPPGPTRSPSPCVRPAEAG